MSKILVIEFEIAIFREKILICISQSTDILKDLFPKEDFSEFENTHIGLAFGATHKDSEYRRGIWLKKWDMSTFIHEAHHITNHILDHVEIKDGETGAFLMEFIYTETIKKIKEKKL